MRELPALALEEFAAQPFQFSASARIDADPSALFAELADPSLWFPLMRRAIWKTGATSGVGALREVDMMGFGRFRERMLAWDHGERVAFTMIGTTSPLIDRMAEDFQLAREGDHTRLTWSVFATPSRAGRIVTPALRGILRLMFMRAARNVAKRAGSYPRESKRVS